MEIKIKRKKILYAEDNQAVRKCVEEILKTEFSDYDIETHNDGISLSRRLNEDVSDIALVVTDNQMPGYSGYKIIKDYARRENLKEIPFVLFYGDDERLGKQAVEDGAFGYVLKGADLEKLTGTIKKALSSK